MTAMNRPQFELLMRPGVHPSRVTGKKVPPPPEYALQRESGLLIERNIAVALRDGVRIFIDVYRPEGEAHSARLPILVGWSPYGKHNTSARLPWPAADVPEDWISPYTAFEAPDPLYWCGQGYGVVFADPRGSWYSQGELRHGGLGEAEDCYDLIEWLATQPWSNGRIGMSGVSYLAAIQWQVAPLHPPHLAAINPCEGFTDWYREFAYHGGIPETGFLPRGCANLQYSTTRTEDTAANVRAHPLYDAYWQSKESALASIEVPAYVIASWSDQGLHTRGTLEAFERIASREKWLEVHGRKKWHYFYRPETRLRQLEFFDHFLKQPAERVPHWPKVRLEVRERVHVGRFRDESQWPLARTRYQRLYLDAACAALKDSPRETSAQVRYQPGGSPSRAVFDYRFASDTELTGPMKLHLWLETEGSDDADVFVAVQKLDVDGGEVPFVFYALQEDGPVALGWLRASHRELDPARTREERPWHPHTRELPLRAGERAPLAIEIWPSSTHFAPGERLRLLIQGGDTVASSVPNAPFARHEDTRNRGAYILHTGGHCDSHLLIPVIPAP